MTVSIIIPTLNEANYLKRTLSYLHLLSPQPIEIIVVDGDSEDETVAIATSAGVQVISCPTRRRSVQMNAGAKIATGDILCFVHGDTLVPDDLIDLISQTLGNSSVVAGGFIAVMMGNQTTRWLTSLHNVLKTYYAPLLFRPHLFFKGLRLLFGDQTIFCRRSTFLQCGGFDPHLPIMEDADFCKRLVKFGQISLVNRMVYTSDRRVQRWGELKANLIYLYIGFLWGMGVSGNTLKQFYKDIR